MATKKTKQELLGRVALKKHVAAIHIGSDLTLVERKMANVLLLNAYEELLTTRTHSIPVPLMCAMLGWDESDNVQRLREAIKKLASTPVEFNLMDDGKESWHAMALISYGEIKGGICTYRYDEFLAERLYNPDTYATINIRVQRLFDSAYALALYENCLRFRNVGSTGWWPVSVYKRLVGAGSKIYDEFKYLKRDAILKPVDEINRLSDIRLSPEFRRTGRKVSDIRFLVSEAPREDAQPAHGTDDIRESDLFKKLRAHGIGDRLAVAWIKQDEARAQTAVEYTEAKARKGQVKGSTAGYLRTVFESGADLGPSVFEAGLVVQAREVVERKQMEESGNRSQKKAASEAKDRAKAAVLALAPRERAAYAQEWLESGKSDSQAVWDEAKGRFRSSMDNIGFNLWLQKRLAEGEPQMQV